MGSLVKEYTREKLTGQIFTPYFIVEKILDDVGYDSPDILGKKILDPACGDGRFLVKIAERIIKYSKPENIRENLLNIYGWDIDAEAVASAHNKLNKLVEPYDIEVDWNLEVTNSLYKISLEPLLFDLNISVEKFDFIVGNPPYIRIQHLDIEQRKFIQQNYEFCNSGSTDIYIAFYELAINLLKQNGICCFITPNTFFQTSTAKKLRHYFETRKNLIQITNYGHIQLFGDATTYSAIVIFNKKKNKSFLYQSAVDKTKFIERQINFDEITGVKFWQLSTKKINHRKGRRLGDIAEIHVGITTLADKVYMLPFVKQEEDYIYLNSKYNGIIKIEKGILKPIIKVSTLKSGDESIKEYVIFPYKKVDGKHRIIPEKELREEYPLAYEYLISLKNILDKRDNGNPNTIAWYAFGRSQSLDTSFGEKILFSPINKYPNFILSKNKKATFYSGYCIKYDGNYEWLLKQLNSERMKDFIRISSRDFRGGWKAYNKKIVQEFIIYDE